MSLIAAVARDHWKEVPCFAPYRRSRLELWYECKAVDLVLWLSDMSNLNDFRRARVRALRMLIDEKHFAVATH